MRSAPINYNLSLNPLFLTGFIDGDGSFNILVFKDIRGKLLCKVQPLFTIGLHKKDLPLLLMIKKYFGGIGKIYTRKADETVHYNINSLKDILKYVIPRLTPSFLRGFACLSPEEKVRRKSF